MNLLKHHSLDHNDGSHRTLTIELLVLALIIIAGFSSRFLLGDIPNFKPIAALALFGGFYFQRSALAVVSVVAVLMASDFFLGSYSLLVVFSVYFSLALGVCFGRRLQRSEALGLSRRYLGVTWASLLMAVVFFAVTNFAVWVAWYPATYEGFVSCYFNALPFFKYTLAGNLFFSIAAFAIYDFARSTVASLDAVAVNS